MGTQSIRLRLESEKVRLQEELGGLRVQKNENSELGDRASEAEGMFFSTTMKDRLSSLLVRVERALSKTRSGEYGVCERCGNNIEADRLAVIPEAELCSSCMLGAGEMSSMAG